MAEPFQRVQFRSSMVVIRHLADEADAELAEFFYRELMKEAKKLAAKFRLGNDFVIAKQSRTDVVSRAVRNPQPKLDNQLTVEAVNM